MEKIITLLHELFNALEPVESPLLIAELILTAVMTHRLRQTNFENLTATKTAPAQDPAPTVVADQTPTTTIKDKKIATKQLKNQLMLDVDLLFSDKADEDFTEEENQRCARLLNYIQEMKK